MLRRCNPNYRFESELRLPIYQNVTNFSKYLTALVMDSYNGSLFTSTNPRCMMMMMIMTYVTQSYVTLGADTGSMYGLRTKLKEEKISPKLFNYLEKIFLRRTLHLLNGGMVWYGGTATALTDLFIILSS